MDDRTERFLEAAIERDWINAKQVDECRRIMETVAEVGVEQTMEEILVRKGYLTPDQVRKLSRGISVRQVGKYQVLEKLGEGGAGIVYKANQAPLERVVAIKVLSRRRVENEKYLERFLREARVAVTLNHRNIVRGLDYGEADGYHYFVMEYVEGDSLHTVLKREGTLDEKRALEITLQVVDALQHAAQYDLVHRDIKPDNILIAEGGVAKLCDLGLAKPSLLESAQASQDGTTIGTPTYMSPEQIRGRDDTDFRSDVYSLGATLYHLVAGQPPFTGESADILVRKHLRDPLTDPREHNVKLSSSAAAVIVKMLAKKPEDRYGSLDDLAEDLKSVLEGRPPTHTIQLGGRSGPPPKVHLDDAATRRVRRPADEKKSRAPLLVGVVVLLLAGGAAAVILGRGGGKDGDGGGETVATVPDAPAEPTPDELAENLYLEAQDYAERNPEADPAAKIDRFRLVIKKYPETRHGLLAKDRIREIEGRRDATERAYQEKAKSLFDDRIEVAGALVKAGRYGDAIRELAAYPNGYEDTEYPARLAAESRKVGDQAEEARKAAFAAADGFVRSGNFEKAVLALEPLAGAGIPEIESAVRDKLAEVRAAEKEERAARERGRKVFRAELGGAFLKAADGDWSGAERDLVAAGGREELVYYGEELNAASRDVRAAKRFEDALRDSARKITGRSERFALIGGARAVAAGKVLGANDAGIRLARAGGEEMIPFHTIVPQDLARLAFESLDANRAEDHEAAAFYLVVHGFLTEAEAEIRAAAVMGAATERIEGVRTLFGDYLKDRADVEILKAEGYRGRDRLPEARELLKDVAGRTPWYPDARYSYGAVLVESGQLADALPELETALALGCSKPKLHYYLGEALLGANRPEEALHAFSHFADLMKDDPAELEKVRGKINELREKALKARIDELVELGKEATRRKSWEEAVEVYRKLNDLSPNAEDCLYFLGKAHLELRQILESYRAFRAFLEAAPTSRRAADARRQVRSLEKDHKENAECVKFLTEGMTEFHAGNYQLAVALFDRALTEGPLSEDAYYNRYLAHLRLGESLGKIDEYEAALADLDSVEFLNPAQPLVYEGRALVLYYLDRKEESLANANRAILALPDRWQSYNIAGIVHRLNGNAAKAVEVLSQGIEKAPIEVTLYINRALAYEGLRQYEKARADLRAASDRKPSAFQVGEIGKALDRILKAEKGD